MEFSGQNTGVGSFSLLWGIFPTQGSNPGLLHCRWLLYQLSHKGSPWLQTERLNNNKQFVKMRDSLKRSFKRSFIICQNTRSLFFFKQSLYKLFSKPSACARGLTMALWEEAEKSNSLIQNLSASITVHAYHRFQLH